MLKKLLFLAFVCAGMSFAQVRDLFAEFEAEANAAESSSSVEAVAAPAPESSAASSSSVAEAPAAVPETTAASSSSVMVSSSSVAISSSSIAPSSSSVEAVAAPAPESSAASSSSVAVSSSSEIPSSSSIAEVPAPVQESPVAQDTAAVVQDSTAAVQDSASVVPDSANVTQDTVPEAVPESSSSSADSAVVAAVESSSSVVASSSSVSRSDILGPTKVSKVYGMDEIKGKYKSPKKALFMSLIVPGSGQLYVGGSTFTNVRGGVYLALEAGLWGSWYYFSVHKYNEQVKKYKKFAKKNFSIAQYEQKMHDIFGSLDGTDEEANFRIRYMGSREGYCESIYGEGKATSNGCYNSSKTFENDGSHTMAFVGPTMGDDLARVKVYDASELYAKISDANYVLGWLDVSEEANVSDLHLENADAEKVALGSSSRQKKYKSMRDKANDYANLQAWFFGGIILNHLVSAIDAALTANSHNKSLYEEKLSWYDRLHLEGYIVPIQGERATVLNAYWNF